MIAIHFQESLQRPRMPAPHPHLPLPIFFAQATAYPEPRFSATTHKGRRLISIHSSDDDYHMALPESWLRPASRDLTRVLLQGTPPSRYRSPLTVTTRQIQNGSTCERAECHLKPSQNLTGSRAAHWVTGTALGGPRGNLAKCSQVTHSYQPSCHPSNWSSLFLAVLVLVTSRSRNRLNPGRP